MTERASTLDFIKLTNATPDQLKMVQAFSCGEQDIDTYLKTEAIKDAKMGLTTTWLVFLDNTLFGYFSLTVDRVTVIKSSKLRTKVKEKDPNERIKYKRIPSIQIHHFALSKEFQKKPNKFGLQFMRVVLKFIQSQLLSKVGACLITVYSIDNAVGFYEKVGFIPTGDSIDQINKSMAIFTGDLFNKE